MGAKQFAPWNIFSALLLLPDLQSLSMSRKVFEGFGMKIHASTSVQEANQILHSTRLDLVICDFDVPRADELSLLHPSTHWRGITVGLVSSSWLDHSGRKRVQFRIPKPVSVDMLIRSLKASYSSMAQQRIATFRHTVPIKLVGGTLNHRGWQRALHQVNVLNVSQTGLCLNAAEPLPHGASLTMSLVLPESSSVHASGNVIWSHSNGRTGIAFERSSCPEMKRFQEQLNSFLPGEFGMVAEKQAC